jgi:hypothetical protein
MPASASGSGLSRPTLQFRESIKIIDPEKLRRENGHEHTGAVLF